MKQQFSRRDFLKLTGSLPLGFAMSELLKKLGAPKSLQGGQKNVLIIVFDALSAYHISTYGYQRETTPHLARLSEQAIVYHNHHAGGNFTTPGTASILTGTLPWTHRALQLKSTVVDSLANRNIFSLLKNHYRIAYSHNSWANLLLDQFSGEMDELIPQFSLFLESYDRIIQRTFKNDYDVASVSWLRNTDVIEEGFSYSLFLSHFYETLREQNFKNLRKEYPRGVPAIERAETHFLLDEAINRIGERLTLIPQPFFGYFHFLPPHQPYRTSLEFIDAFARDGYRPLDKPEDVFTEKWTRGDLLKKRDQYDEFILHVDKQFNIFFEHLGNSGLLENTWMIFTSDHGEMFERGIDGHSNDAMYQPVLRVPLMIFEPGRANGEHVFAPTSAIDILPTILQITGQDIPAWAEGEVLPPFAGQSPDMNRSVYSVRANKTEINAPITRASTTVVKNGYKLHYYLGYTDLDLPAEFIKLFDIESDPEEMVNLSDTHKEIASELLGELKRHLDEANKPYL